MVLYFSACTGNQAGIQTTHPANGDKSALSKFQYQNTDSPSLIIYDYDNEIAGLTTKQIELVSASGNSKKDIINAFLNNNHFLNNEDRVRLLRIEEIGSFTSIYLSSLQDLANKSNQQLFQKALELTILRHLKTKDFNIIYDETTAQL